MLSPLMSSFEPGHMRSRSYSEMMTQIRSSLVPGLSSPYVKKRSHSDMLKSTAGLLHEPQAKRSRTAPTTPPATLSLKAAQRTMRSRSLSPNKRLFPERQPQPEQARPKLPGIAALNIPTKVSVPAITPTISLDYFDTYKPQDEHWRYGLIDAIQKSKNDLSRYSYLSQHAGASKPLFDSRLSSKITNPPHGNMYHERKVNFPYESNYTYLNQTYKRDIERYPEYLELAHSLVSLSRNKQHPPPPPLVPPSSQHQHIYDDARYQPGYVSLPSFSNAQSQSHLHSDSHGQSHHHSHNHRHFNQNTYHRHLHGLPTPSQLPASGSFSPYKPYKHPSGPRLPTTPSHSPPTTKFVPITPPSLKAKSRSDLLKSPPKASQIRVCISCGSDQLPCWRPSWSIREGQLCNSCGLRYKKTSARCLNNGCKKIPAKGEWSLMLGQGTRVFDDGSEGYGCLDCGSRVEVAK